jgi:serine/threonine-protein kinase
MRPLTSALWLKLSPALDCALDLEADERRAYVESIRAADPALASALEALLIQHDRVVASGFLESTSAVDSVPSSLTGQTIGAYTLDRPLGSGGMGTVWLARRSDGRFEGLVAIKFVNLAVLDRAGQERFTREGTLLARLSHPNIARLLDAGVTPGGQPFLVLEYVEGVRIDHHAAEHRLPLEGRLALFLQVSDAVAHAHANLIVHRDLKPSNVLVDREGRVKLLDFGIATLVGADSTSAAITAGAALTPQYAAPEQIAGRPVTTATDVYALGVLLYELLVGRHPTSAEGVTNAAALRGLAEREPSRLSDAASRLNADDPEAARVLDERDTTRERLRRACRGDLDTILVKALKKTAAERYQTVTALADDIRRHLRAEPVSAQPDSAWYRARLFAARHRLELAAAAVTVLALMIGSGLAVRQAKASARERDGALARLRQAEATNEFSSFLLAQAHPAAGAPISNKELLARGEALIDKRFARDPVLRVHMLLSLADRYQENQQFDDRRRVLTRAHDEAAQVPDVGLRVDAACAWAEQFAEHGEPGRAVETIASAISELSPIPEHEDVLGRCLIYQSMSARIGGDGARAIAAGERAVALANARPTSAQKFDAVTALADAYSMAFRFTDAARTYQRAMDVLAAQGLDTTLDAAAVLNNWSVALQNAGRYVDAVPVGARAVAMARAADSENGASMTMLSTYANALSATGDHAAAAAAFDESLQKVRRAGPPRRLITTLTFAILNAAEMGDATTAARLIAEAERAEANDPSEYAKGLVELSAARLAISRNDALGAVAGAHRALAIFEKATANQAQVLPCLTLLARGLNALARYAEALPVAERSLAIARQRLADQRYSSGVGQALLEIAVATQGLGDRKTADNLSAQALEQLLATVGAKASTTARVVAFRRAAAW